MKKLELKKGIEMTRPDGKVLKLDYWAQLQSIMRTPIDVTMGANPDEIRRSCRVIDVLEKAGDNAEWLELEDSDYEYLLQKVQSARFMFADKALVQFQDDVKAAGE